MTPQEQVAEFHRVFGVARKVPITDGPTTKLRIALLEEELQELRDALAAEDIIAVADALTDIAYVTYGAAITWGIDLDIAFAEVHRSNMTKMPANGKPTKHFQWQSFERCELLTSGSDGCRSGCVIAMKTKEPSAEARLFSELEMLGRMAWTITQLEAMVRSQLDALHEAEQR